MRSAALVVVLALAACAAPGAAPAPAARRAVLDEVWETVRERFYDPDLHGVDWAAARERARPAAEDAEDEAAFARAVNGMLRELGASHTAYFTRDDLAFYALLELFWDGIDEERRARFFPAGPPPLEGIGLLTEEVEGACFARGVLAGSPAAAAGIVVGDRLVAVEGEPYRPVASFRGRAGRRTRVTLQRTRDPGSARELVLVPEALPPSALFLRALWAGATVVEREGQALAVAHVWSYAGEAVQAALAELLLDGPLAEADGLVLDLRGGFGGANPEYLNLFRRDLAPVAFVDRAGTVHEVRTAWERPVVLLIDEGTSSGKELLAHGFRRQARGPIVGARSAGAVLGGSAFLMADGSLVYLAVNDVLVDKEHLEGVGVAPDVEVRAERPYSGGVDVQLERALAELARSLSE